MKFASSHFLFILLTATCVVPTVTAQSSESTFIEEADDDSFTQSEDDWKSGRSSDLSTSQGERREDADDGVLFVVGEASAWSSIAVRGIHWFDDDIALAATLGVGKFRRLGKSGTTDLTIGAKSATLRGQWWPTPKFPLAVMTDLGFHQWQAESSCVTHQMSGACAGGKWTAAGGSGSIGLLLSWLAEETVMVEWTIIALKHSRPWSEKWDGAAGDPGEGEAKDFVKSKGFFGVSNFAVGMRF